MILKMDGENQVSEIFMHAKHYCTLEIRVYRLLNYLVCLYIEKFCQSNVLFALMHVNSVAVSLL